MTIDQAGGVGDEVPDVLTAPGVELPRALTVRSPLGRDAAGTGFCAVGSRGPSALAADVSLWTAPETGLSAGLASRAITAPIVEMSRAPGEHEHGHKHAREWIAHSRMPRL
jgi:hypothetical protein